MSPDPDDAEQLRPRFWEEVPLRKMNAAEWEALCDGCGKCCLNKLEDADSGEVFLTRIACRLLDNATCRCGNYPQRKRLVPECIVLTPGNIAKHAYWMPETCAYRLLWQRRPLYDWHPLVSGDAGSVHRAGISVAGRTLSELTIPDENDWEDYLIEEPT